MAVTSPTRAVGRVTLRMERQRGDPSASAASVNELGTMAMTSIAARVTIGNITTDSANEAAKPVEPFTPRGFTQNKYTKMPAMMAGEPFMASTTLLTSREKRLRLF